MLADVPPLVAGVDDQRVLGDAELVEGVEDPLDPLVDRGDAAVFLCISCNVGMIRFWCLAAAGGSDPYNVRISGL